MAVAILSPWPDTPAALAAARACLREALEADGIADDRLDALGAVASELVEHYAAGAPAALRREAVIRAAGWLLDTPRGNLRSLEIGPFKSEFAASQRGALLHSGAKSLLYAWRTKTAGIAR